MPRERNCSFAFLLQKGSESDGEIFLLNKWHVLISVGQNEKLKDIFSSATFRAFFSFFQPSLPTTPFLYAHSPVPVFFWPMGL